MTTPTSYFRIKTESAPKTSLNAKGCISYAVLRDADRSDAFFCLLSNDAGGYFSEEAVPLSAIKRCLQGVNVERPVPAKTFKAAFRGKSANNSGFLVAALRHENLLLPAPDAAHQHMLSGNWNEWQRAVLAEIGEPFELPEVAKVRAKQANAIAISNAEQTQSPEHRQTKKPRKSSTAKGDLPTATTEGSDDDCPT